MAFDFLKKKNEAAAAPPQQNTSSHVDKVLTLRQQGLSNNQIIQNLQKQGIPSSEIFDAMNQADLAGKEVPQSYFQEQGMPPQQEPPQQEIPQSQPPPMEEESTPQPEGIGREEMEETVEAIVNEKWEELIKDVGKIVEWKNKVESKLGSLEQEFKDLKSDFENLHKAIIGKIGEYDQNILNVGTEVKAMEKVFQKVLPKMTENVNELSRITREVKRKK